MANLYLSSGDKLSGLTFGGNVFGSNGSESVSYASGVTGINVDQNVEQVNLGNPSSSYTFQQQGNNLVVFSGTTEVARIAVQSGAVDTEGNGTRVAFSNGVVEAKLVAGSPPTITLGGATVPAAAAGPVIPVVIDGSGGTGAQVLTLTANQDTLVGTANADTFNANVVVSGLGGGALTDTLQNIDSLDGGEGTDTLNVTVNGGAVVTPVLKSIENVSIRSTAAGSGVSFKASTGVNSITVENSVAATGTIAGVGAASLSVKNQNTAVTFDDQTATTLNLTVDTVGVVSATAPAEVAIDIGAGTASKATTLNITANNSNVEIKDTAGTNVATSATIAATGANELKLTDGLALGSVTITGAGSVDLSEVDLVKVATLTVGDGGVTFKNGTSTATSFTATTGAGKDTLTIDGANVATVSTGAGDDKVTTAVNPLAATATINLGAGNDTLTLGAASAAGATLTGGDGTDTLAAAYAAYNTISGYSAANLAKITGFEVLSITGAALADTNVVDLSKIAGLTSAQILGVATTKAASITNVGAASSVVLKGDLATDNGSLTISLKDATGASDSLNLTLNHKITQNNDGTVDTSTSSVAGITASGVETINFTSTGTLSTAVTTGSKTDIAFNALNLTDDALVTLNAGGDQGFSFTSAAGMTKLATIDASANTGAGSTINVSAAAAGTAAAITITGSAGSDTIVGSANADTISGGAGNDVITGGAGADKLSGGAGNDRFVITAATDSTLAQTDIISDFVANTFGQGTNGAANADGAALADIAKFTGDVIDLRAATPTKLELLVVNNAADAQTFIQNSATDATLAAVNVALDSSTSKLYIDFDNNGTVDTVIQLTGVTTITTAAFVIA